MARKPPHPCRFPGCPELTREPFCHNHKGYEKAVKRNYEKRYYPNRDPMYHQVRWQKLRDWFAARHPLCQECFEDGRVVPMKIVDHIVEVQDGGARFDEENLQSLCQECHNRKTGDETKKRRAVG